MIIELTVLGEPKGKERPRFTKSGRPYTPSGTANYETLVKLSYQQKYQNGYKFEKGTMLKMEIDTYYAIPQSKSKKIQTKMLQGEIRPTKKPDADNVLKIVADSLNQIAYHDDSQIVEAVVKKYYSNNPRIDVVVKEIWGV